jgi:hypothetical protein
MCAVPMRRGDFPKRFDNRMRTRRPPIVVRTIIRIVWLSKTPSALTSTNCGSGGRIDAAV